MVSTIVTTLTKQFAEAKSEPKRPMQMHIVPWKPKAENWETAKTNPYHLSFCLSNEYDNPQMQALLFSVHDVAEADNVLESEFAAMLEAIKSEYEHFHGIVPTTKSSENWPKTRSARLLYGDVKIDGVYRKRAERHLREIVKFESEILPGIAAIYAERAAKKAARKATA
jgi:hypothetical protein